MVPAAWSSEPAGWIMVDAWRRTARARGRTARRGGGCGVPRRPTIIMPIRRGRRTPPAGRARWSGRPGSRWAASVGSRSIQWSTSARGTTSVWPVCIGSIERNATHSGSRHTNRPGSSPSMIRVKTDGMSTRLATTNRRPGVCRGGRRYLAYTWSRPPAAGLFRRPRCSGTRAQARAGEEGAGAPTRRRHARRRTRGEREQRGGDEHDRAAGRERPLPGGDEAEHHRDHADAPRHRAAWPGTTARAAGSWPPAAPSARRPAARRRSRIAATTVTAVSTASSALSAPTGMPRHRGPPPRRARRRAARAR